MLLSDKRILEEREAGNIVIEPFDERCLGNTSYDCRLGWWYYTPQPGKVLNPLDEQSVRAFWGQARDARKSGYLCIPPGVTILAHTIERIGGRNGFTAAMHARSTIGRCGLVVACCAGWGDVGFIAPWTMEIRNFSPCLISLPIGLRVCQISFEQVGEVTKEYHGKYGQEVEWKPEDMLPKLYQDWDVADLATFVS